MNTRRTRSGIQELLTLILLNSIVTVQQLGQQGPLASGNVRFWGSHQGGQPTTIAQDLTNVVAVEGGYFQSVALRDDGTVRSWGSSGPWATPIDATNVIAIAAGSMCLALRADGRVVGWGGDGLVKIPSTWTNVIAIATSGNNNLALKADGSVVRFGDIRPGVTNIPPGLRATRIACSDLYSLAIRPNGTVVAWGICESGQDAVPSDLTNAVAISAGAGHCLALRGDGGVVGWGSNSYGQSAVPRDLTNALAIATGAHHSVVLKADGTVVAWGWNDDGQCNVPESLPAATAIGAGFSHTLAVISGQPWISHPPSSQTAAIGSTVSFTVHADGAPPPTYQWFHGAEPVAEATNAVLVLNDVQVSMSGAYSVVVSNKLGSITSARAMLSVLPGLDIAMVPALTLHGELGLSYRIEYIRAIGPTSDWHTLASVTITNTPQQFFDTSAAGDVRRLYRLVQTP